MRYLFGDSTESNIDRNFLELLESFVDTSAETIPYDDSILVLKRRIEDRNKLMNSVLKNMDSFQSAVETTILGQMTGRTDIEDRDAFLRCAEQSKDFVKKSVDNCKTKFIEDISLEISPLQVQINESESENTKTLDPFFMKEPLNILNKKYTVKAIEEEYSAKVQVDCEDGISYVYNILSSEIPFWDSHVKAGDFLNGIKIPIRMKKSLFKKDLTPDIINIDDYYLSELEISKEDLNLIFKERLDVAALQVRLKMIYADDSVEIYYTENNVEKNINEIPELEKEIDKNILINLRKEIIDKTRDFYDKRRNLESIFLQNKDVIKENHIFDLMVKIAEIFSPTMVEIKNHSPNKEELSLKIEDNDRRTEIFIKKSKIKEKLSTLNERGDKLLNYIL